MADREEENETIKNPLESMDVSRADVEARLASSAPDLQLVDRYYSREMAKLKVEMKEKSSAADSAMMGVYARLTEAPTNWQ